ncbi:UNVERIFIED_CONTAM: hypothetical protein Sradi_4369800 [Sesamum radiatum]|uniref:Uncharacterized protein n=1 Tax=Sesamum radiatum TaxID=300843 RepID=A0AAW2NQZ1_SESRA
MASSDESVRFVGENLAGNDFIKASHVGRAPARPRIEEPIGVQLPYNLVDEPFNLEGEASGKSEGELTSREEEERKEPMTVGKEGTNVISPIK